MSDLINEMFDISAIEKQKKEAEDLIKEYSDFVKKTMAETRKASTGDDLLKQTKAINDAIVQGTKAVNDYTAVEKELLNQKKQLESVEAKRYAANSKTNQDLEKNKKLLAEQNTLLKLNATIQDQNTGSIERAEAENKKLQIEKKKLNLETEAGRKKLIEINAAQDRNNELIKESSNGLQKQKIGIGNYKETFTNLIGQFKNGEIGLKGLTTGFFQMAKATLAALWPVGLVAAAIGALYAVFKNFTPLIDKIEQGFAGLTAAWSVLKNSLGQFLSGNQSLKESMGGVGAAMKEAAKDAAALKKADQDLADAMDGLDVANKKLETQMKSLLLQSKNKTLSEKEQMALIDQTIALENQQHENKKKINDEDLRISLENIKVKNRLTEEQYKNLKEQGLDYANELIDQGVQISEAEMERLKTALLTREDIEQESIGIVEKAMNRKDALEEKAAEKAAKRTELIVKQQEETAALVEKAAELTMKAKEKEVDIFEDLVFEETEAEKKKADYLNELNEAVIQNAIDKKQIEYEQKLVILRKEATSEEDFAQKKFDLDKSLLQAAIDRDTKTLESANISAVKRLEIETQLAQAQIDLDNLVLDNFKDNENDKLGKFLEVAEQISSAGLELLGAIADFQAAEAEKRLAELDKQQEKSDELFEKQQANLDKAIMSEASREIAQKKIDDDKAKRDQEILDKKRAEEVRNAKFEKAQNLAEAIQAGALATIQAYTAGPILGPILAVLVGAAALVNIGRIASTQIPAYAEGGITKGEPFSLWGEAGPEMATTPSGHVYFADKPTLSHFDAGTIITNKVGEYEHNMSNTANGSTFEIDYDRMAAAMPKYNFELNGNGSFTMRDKENNRRTAINRYYKIGR